MQLEVDGKDGKGACNTHECWCRAAIRRVRGGPWRKLPVSSHAFGDAYHSALLQ